MDFKIISYFVILKIEIEILLNEFFNNVLHHVDFFKSISYPRHHQEISL
jgi:hypothetical protein